MKSLLDCQFAPLTLKIGFVEHQLPQVSDAFIHWIRQHFVLVEAVPLKCNLQEALMQFEPLTTPPRRIVLLATDSQWTAYFDNGSRGGDPMPPISYLAQQLGCRGLIASCIPHTLESDTGKGRGTYGAVQFELFGPTRGEFLNYVRSISVAYERGQWHFDANGIVQPFENLTRYAARRIVDRFTPEMLEHYCTALGIRLFDEAFYAGPGTLIVIRDPLPDGSREYSLADARRQMGFA